MSVLAVDFGTSNTVAVLSAHDRPPRVVDVDGATAMPSAVFAGPDGLVVGREAERRARLDPARYEPNPKRRIDDGQLLLGDVVVPVTDAIAAVLRKVATETQRQLGGVRPDEVRLTHPAGWGPVRRNVLLAAAAQAGLGPNLTLVPEPVAAAAHYAAFTGRAIGPGEAVAVYDLGAGTFDVAVVGANGTGYAGYSVLAEHGLPDLGGLDVDQALLEHVGGQVRLRDPAGWQRLVGPSSTSDRRAARTLREDVRVAKESLSEHPQTELPLPDPFGDVLVTRAELEHLVRPNLARSVELLAETIRGAGFAPAGLAGVYLVGGSSRIPLVATLITEGLGVVPGSLDQPETAVAFGAHHITAPPQESSSAPAPEPAPSSQGPRPLVPAPAPPFPASPPAVVRSGGSGTAVVAGVLMFVMAVGFVVTGFGLPPSGARAELPGQNLVALFVLAPLAVYGGLRLVRGRGGHVIGLVLGAALPVSVMLPFFVGSWYERLTFPLLPNLVPGGYAFPFFLGLVAAVLCALPSTWRARHRAAV